MAAEPATTLPLHRIDVETYDRMVACGALEGQRVELLEGLIVEMSPLSPAHNAVVTRLMRHFAAAPRWWTQVQSSIEVPPNAEPEPDLAVFAQEPSPKHHPITALLAIEVAVSSHMIDRNVKAKLYAQAGIPTYWVVDVPGRAIEIRTRPSSNGYAHCDICRQGSVIPSPLTGVDDLDIAALLSGVTG
jgi:Uma2 family endonuclease